MKTQIPADYQGEAKVDFVKELFARISPRYDLLNRVMSWGLDTKWRRLVARAGQTGPDHALDVATGTGDLALELARQGSRVTALDFCPEMMALAQGKARRQGLEKSIDFVLGDALKLPFPDNSFDRATSGFVLRNVADIFLCLQEMRRVVRPGGRVLVLELTHPPAGPIALTYQFYLNVLLPRLGSWISGHGDAYAYLPRSLASFPAAPGLKALMEKAGLYQVSYIRLGLGTVALHVGLKV